MYPQDGRHDAGDLAAVGERREFGEPHPVGGPADELGPGLERQPGLAAAAGTRERHKPGRPDQLADLGQLALPADERAQQRGQVVRELGVVQRGERRELRRQEARLELEYLLRPAEVLEPVQAKVLQAGTGRERAS